MTRHRAPEDLPVRCVAVRWKPDARENLRTSEFIALVDDLVHVTKSDTVRGQMVTLACYPYTSRLGWMLQMVAEPVSCLACIAEMS